MMKPDDELIAAATALLTSVDFDNNGMMVAGVYRGGNGGLISRETTKAADDLRRVLDARKAIEK